MHHVVLFFRIIDTLQFDNLRVFINAFYFFACRFCELETAGTKGIIQIGAAVRVKCLIDPDLRMSQKLLLCEVRRCAGNRKVASGSHGFGHIAVCSQKLNRHLVRQC